MKRGPSYRAVIFIGTVLTGLTGLVYQVVWQKYLSFVVGSEARSVSMVVAVFLAGLAAGYRFWGRRTEGAQSRRRLLMSYGAIELGIGAWAALFPAYLSLLRWVAYGLPASLLADLAVTLLALGLPTFLMGATIPLLVSVIPERSSEIHLCHARIYGLNTLGACLGAFGASFFLIPRFGLPETLWIASAVNFVVGVVFLFNRLDGGIAKSEPVPSIPNRFGTRSIYAYTLITGMATLSLEVLFVRVMHLTIGAGPHNFAIVVGVFILGLALGSLAVTQRRLSLEFLFRAQAVLIGSLVVVFYTVPFWPYWISNVRALLESYPINYGVYLAALTAFLMLLLLPFLIPLGAMLPLVYALIPKGTRDYGNKCGWIYFFNTVGTGLGAIVLSYLLLLATDLPSVYKLDVALLGGLAAWLLVRERRHLFAAALSVVVVLFVVGPGWNRGAHEVGLFKVRDSKTYTLQGVFSIPRIADRVRFFDDGPDTTVTVVGWNRPGALARSNLPPESSTSLVINGNTDGDTLLDYSTIHLAALLPYLHAPARSDLRATVVGLGAGVTAGYLARAEDVAALTAVEISGTLVDAASLFDDSSYELTRNPKARILAMDGFRYFSRIEDELDIVVSASSAPWVGGVENLFTPEFYRLVHDAMADDGVFLQWYPLYSMDGTSLRTIVRNVGAVFPHLRLYRISNYEAGLLASKRPLPERPDVERFQEDALRDGRSGMHLVDVDLLALIRLLDDDELRRISSGDDVPEHSLRRPALSYRSDRLRFLDEDVDWDRFIAPGLVQGAAFAGERIRARERLLERYPRGLPCSEPYEGARVFCDVLHTVRPPQEP